MRRLFATAAFMPCLLLSQANPVDEAVADLRSGHTADAETILTRELRVHPDNADAVALLAVVDDQLQKFSDAERLYARAIVLAPNDPALLNNYSNHLLASGRRREAEQKFRRVLQIEPSHVNARIELAALALEDKQPTQAQSYLSPLASSIKNTPRVALLDMQLRYEQGETAQGDAIAAHLQSQAQSLNDSMALASALFAAGQYEKACALFAQLAARNPTNAQAAYYLGLAQSKSGHNEQALAALTKARSIDPKNASLLYDLAVVQRNLDQRPEALDTLAAAARIEPNRADVKRLTADTLLELGYFSDAATALDAYLKLEPQDTRALRDRAYAESALGHDVGRNLVELKSYVQRNPSDATGYYELAMAQTANDLSAAAISLNQAIRRQPGFAAAYMAQGMIFHKQGQDEAAVAAFTAVLRVQPRNVRAMEHLAQSYSVLDRNQEALALLKNAAAIAPDDPSVLVALGRALLKNGDPQQAAQAFKRARELGVVKPDPSAGLLAFLKLAPAERAARYRAGVKRAAQQDPGNVEAQVLYLLVLPKSDSGVRAKIAVHIIELNPSAATLVEAATGLLSSEEPDPATAQILIGYGVRQYPADFKLSALVQAAAQLGTPALERAAVLNTNETR